MSMEVAPGTRRRPSFDLADRLRKARELTGMEKQEFAEAIGVHRDSIANYEAGRRKPRRPVIVAWAIATGVDVDWLDPTWSPPRQPVEASTYGLVVHGFVARRRLALESAKSWTSERKVTGSASIARLPSVIG